MANLIRIKQNHPKSMKKNRIMEVCRICLAADRKMFVMDTKHKELYENVTGITVQPKDRLPKHICWECRHLMSKYYMFRKKAVLSHFIIMEITQNKTSLEEHQPISTLTCTGIVYSNLDGVDNEELEEIEFKSEADQISICEEETNFSSYDNDNINVVRDNKAKDDLYDQANLTRKETVEIVTNIEFNGENVENVREIVRNDNEIIEKTVKNLNTIEISEDDGKNDIDIESTENAVENLNINEILDNPPSDYTDCASNGNDEISSKSIKNISSEPIDETSKSKKKLELDKTLRTVTMLSKEEQIAEMKKKEKHYNYVNVNRKFTEPMVFNGIQFAKTLRVELRKYNAPAEYAQLYGAPLKKPKADSLKVKNNSKVSNEESVNSNAKLNVSELFKKTEHLQEEKDLADYTETVVGDKNNSIIETCKDKFICDDCGHQFHKKDSIILHIKKKHFKDVYIGYKKCAYSSVTKERLEKHSELKHEIRKYFCDICNNGFTSEIILKRHIVQRCNTTHSVVEPYLCTKCGKKFNLNHEEFKRHMRTHSAEKPYYCAVCNRQFSHSSSLNTHMRTHTGEKPHSCTKCDKQFIRIADLKIHMRTHTGEKPYSCKVCNKKFSQSNGLNQHMRTHSAEKPYSCAVCNKQFSLNTNLNKHMRTHSAEKPYSCAVCNRKFSQSSNLNVHMKTHTGEKPHSCTVCTRQFILSSSLKKHMRIHTAEKPYSCKVCNKKFSHSSNLNVHMRTHTGEKPYSCKVCNKKFSQSNGLNQHMRTHSAEKPYSCAVCNKQFSLNTNLNKHMRTHSAEKPYSCAVCNRKFSQSSNLNVHMKTHTGEKPHSCTVCTRQFILSSSLKKHMRIHTAEKPYSCKVCNKKFSHSSNLNVHMRIHTGEKRHSCTVCSKQFFQRAHLQSHARNHVRCSTKNSE